MYPVLLESFKKGKISEDEMKTHPNRNALRSALTGEEIPIIDLKESSKTLEKNDILILATDGLLTLSEKDIQEILNRNYNNSAENICKKLLIEVSDRKKRKQDNTLIEVIKISEGADGSSLSKNKALYIILFLFFAVIISSAIVFWAELNSFFTVPPISIPAAKKSEEVVVPKPFQFEQPSVAVINQENTPDKEKNKTNDDIKVASKDNNKAVANGKQKATGKAQEINKTLASPQKNTSMDSPPQPKLDSKSGDPIVELKDKQPVDSASNKSSAEKAPGSDTNKSQVQIDVETDNKNIEKKITNQLDEYLKNKVFN
jgi:hypothetical protein